MTATAPSITIYSTHTCPFCKMTKHFLDEKSVAYNEIYVDDDEAKKNEMINLSGQMGTPVILLGYPGGERRQFVGFDPAKLEKLVTGEIVGDALVQDV